MGHDQAFWRHEPRNACRTARQRRAWICRQSTVTPDQQAASRLSRQTVLDKVLVRLSSLPFGYGEACIDDTAVKRLALATVAR